MTNQNLLPVFTGKIAQTENLLCDARKLHEFLQVSSRFTTWITRRIEEYSFQENQDFIFASQNWEAKKRERWAQQSGIPHHFGHGKRIGNGRA